MAFFAHAFEHDALIFLHQQTGCVNFTINVRRQRHKTKIPHFVKNKKKIKKKKRSSSGW